MNLDSAETWRWIWLGAVVVFGTAELVTPIAFFFLPFAAAALAAAVLGFAGVGVTAEWLVFIAAAAASCAVLWPIGRRLERRTPRHPVGANRWVGREAVVTESIPAEAGGTGSVRLGRETWRAEAGMRTAIPAGSTVLVTRVDGTRLVVLPIELPLDQGET